uniref:Uncharacterized protein n=1 Tax=Haptolina brevifila TaxID=156173 RepID=A0A7S2BWH5_9EUKA|mmetsp:Transcript_17671/g.35599  ORF Transcript_17671/g.35599 Transcript_17671/m.35599 type:complete len:179 (+) Transcript_17671:1-537(+)
MALVVHKQPNATDLARRPNRPQFFTPSVTNSTETSGLQLEVEALLEQAMKLADKGNALAAVNVYRTIISIDPGCIAAFEGHDRMRMDQSVAIVDDALVGAQRATNKVAQKVLSLWQRDDTSKVAAEKFKRLVRHPTPRKPVEVNSRDACCGMDSLAGCISKRRLTRAQARQLEILQRF